MKKITNSSTQSVFINFNVKGSQKSYFLTPGKFIIVPESYNNPSLNNLIKKRVLNCKIVNDPVIVTEAKPEVKPMEALKTSDNQKKISKR